MASPFLNTRELAIYLRFVTPEGEPQLRRAVEWVDRHGLPKLKRGRAVLVYRDDVNDAIGARQER